MVISVSDNENEKKTVSYLQIILDVFVIFVLGLFLLLVFRTFTKNKTFFTIAMSIYLIIFSMYTLLYLSMVTERKIIEGIHHRAITFINVYNVFLAIFMIVLGNTFASEPY